jgi:secreted PhoX family phosphatase
MEIILNKIINKKLSRRSFLKGAALLSSMAVVPVSFVSQQAYAAGAASKASMQYVDHPNGKKDCVSCTLFIPGKTAKADGTCKVVEGAVKPQGYCIAFAPKA